MPGFGRSELYFMSAMMLLILLVCGVAVYAFFKTYRKEMNEKKKRLAARTEKRPTDAEDVH